MYKSGVFGEPGFYFFSPFDEDDVFDIFKNFLQAELVETGLDTVKVDMVKGFTLFRDRMLPDYGKGRGYDFSRYI